MIYKQLSAQWISNIESGKIAAHSRMPSLRNFKVLHNISMTSALNCYQHLEALGWIIAKPQSGFFVCQQVRSQAQPELIHFESHISELKSGLNEQSYTPFIKTIGPLGYTRIDPRQLPLEQLQQSFRRAIKRQSADISFYPNPQGEKVLRNSLSAHFKGYDFHFSSEQLIISNGCMDAIQTAIEITTNVGDAVAISSPCYSGLLDMLAMLSRKVIEIPSTAQGIDLLQLEKQMQNGKVKAGLFCTSHMNPQGISMSAAQKQQLVILAEKYQIPIIEDDVYLEIAHGKVIPLPAKHWDKQGYVLWCGSVSKSLAAGYRLGWCLPGRYYDQYLAKRRYCNQGVTSPTQLAIADFINNGEYAGHLKKIRFNLHNYRLDYQHYLRQNLPVSTKISEPSGGFVLWIQIPNLDSVQLFKQALKYNIDIRVGDHFTTLGLYKDCFRINIGYPLLTADAFENETLKQLKKLIDIVAKMTSK
ncbi:MAG: DNA-binding transcriptional MocR family regulator [Psychromonas sp.]|jgi:DNA-binding transcriptional MocR family regulator|uniref:aminotransferase-like domain-containing protein n=1 Tax=Psychromonas sp. TaxID=1884585 RepID=UPI0039E24AE5